MPRLALTFAAGLLLSGIAHADVYKYTDSKGNTQYTDKPAVLPAERLNVQSQKTDTVALNKRIEDENKRLSAQGKTQQNAASQAADQKNAQQLSASDKAERCTKARERYDTYMNSPRLYEENNGERRYLSEAELNATRAAAKTSMDALCQ